MRVLVIGSGAREHALLLALRRDASVSDLHCAPGNAGTARIATGQHVDPVDADAVVALTRQVGADLVVIGSEVPLVLGVADAVRAAGFVCFGPSAAAARIEGSKAFAKDVMNAVGVRTAHSEVVDSPALLDAALARFGPHWVVKDDRIAAGKGVVVTTDLDAARRHAASLLDDGHPVLLESYLDGPEVSLFCLVDGDTVVPLLPAQDAKRVADGDVGPNTGGMGAYAPLPWAPDGLVEEATRSVLEPTVAEMARRGAPFVGLLYAGLALTRDGIRVVEFNARFGDPETQVVLALLETPLAGLLWAAATGRLGEYPPLVWNTGAAVTVVIAAQGYPLAPRAGASVGGLAGAAGRPGVHVLQAGTSLLDGTLRASGGRVLSVTAVGADLAAARSAAYDAVDRVELPGGHYRRDIALAAVDGRISVPQA